MTSQRVVAKKGTPRFRFVNDTVAELKKVIWLSRREIIYLTTIILIVVLLVGAFLGLLDFGFSKLIDGIFLR